MHMETFFQKKMCPMRVFCALTSRSHSKRYELISNRRWASKVKKSIKSMRDCLDRFFWLLCRIFSTISLVFCHFLYQRLLFLSLFHSLSPSFLLLLRSTYWKVWRRSIENELNSIRERRGKNKIRLYRIQSCIVRFQLL